MLLDGFLPIYQSVEYSTSLLLLSADVHLVECGNRGTERNVSSTRGVYNSLTRDESHQWRLTGKDLVLRCQAERELNDARMISRSIAPCTSALQLRDGESSMCRKRISGTNDWTPRHDATDFISLSSVSGQLVRARVCDTYKRCACE